MSVIQIIYLIELKLTILVRELKVLGVEIGRLFLKKNNIATKLNNNLAYYRILPENRSSNRIMNLIWLWKINNKFNNLTIIDNMRSILGIMINSLKKYGFK